MSGKFGAESDYQKLRQGRTALITGASRGIGAAVARRLAADGTDVALQYHSSGEAAELVAADCRKRNVRAETVRADLRDHASASQLATWLNSVGMQPDIIVHCAGIAHYALLEDTGESDWDALMGIHLRSAYAITKALAPAMAWNRRGRIVYLSSQWGESGAAGEAAYAAAKGGLNAFAKSMARELASSGVTVNAVAPGAIDTDMLRSLGETERADLAAEIPLGRLGITDEVAQLVRFLVSDGAGYITGQVIGLNGGWRM